MDDDQLSVTTRTEEGRTVVVLAGELDVDTAPQLAATLDEFIAGDEVTAVIVDVSALTFIDSTGLRVILAGRERLQAAGATLGLEGASGVVERVLDMTGLRGLLANQS